jgi:serine protease Do
LIESKNQQFDNQNSTDYHTIIMTEILENGSNLTPQVIVKKGVSLPVVITVGLLTGLIGSVGGNYVFANYGKQFNLLKSNSAIVNTNTIQQDIKVVNEDSQTITVSKKSKESVVSIVAKKDLQNLRRNLSNPFGSSFNDLFGNGISSDVPTSGSSPSLQEVSAGTGFIVNDQGFIVTNRHVVEDKTASYTVILNDGKEVEGTVLDRDTVLDIAVVKIDNSSLKVSALTLGDSDKIQVGQVAIAIGNSLGEFSNSVSKGIISGLNRTITAADDNGANEETLNNVIQTDASINSGNSGGPLLDIDGSVIGVNVAKSGSGESIGFAIPVNSIKRILESVVKNGKIIRPYLGVRYVEVTEQLAKDRALKSSYGALLEGNGKSPAIITAGPADIAGLKTGDIITEINGKSVKPPENLRSIISDYSVDDLVKVTVQRGDQKLDITLVLKELK